MDSCPLWLIRLFPLLRWWPMVNSRSLHADFLAGLTGAIVVLPQGVAFATIAGMPPEYGLYAGMIPAIIAALYGSSWHLVSGPTTAASVVLFSSLSIYAEPASTDYVSLALTLTFMVGVIQILLGAVRLGTLVNFIKLKERQPEQQHVLLVAAGINFVDLAGVEMLERETKSLRAAGGDLYLCNIKPKVEESLRLSGMLEYLGKDHLFHTKKEAIRTIVARLNPNNCETCSTLSFAECAGTPAAARFD